MNLKVFTVIWIEETGAILVSSHATPDETVLVLSAAADQIQEEERKRNALVIVAPGDLFSIPRGEG